MKLWRLIFTFLILNFLIFANAIFAENLQLALRDSQPSLQYPAVGQFYNGFSYCTATLISSNMVLTAAHCVLSPIESQKKWKTCEYPTGFYSGELDSNSWFEIVAQDGHYKYIAREAKSFGSSLGFRDVAVILLHSHVPRSVARPFRVRKTRPYEGTPIASIGYGCTQVQWSDQCGGRYIGDANTWGIKRILQMNFGEIAYQTCSGDSGGPWFVPYDRSIFRVTSYSPRMSETERRNQLAKAHVDISKTGYVTLYYDRIQRLIKKHKDSCSVIHPKQKPEFFTGHCLTQNQCQKNGHFSYAGFCPNHTDDIQCCIQ